MIIDTPGNAEAMAAQASAHADAIGVQVCPVVLHSRKSFVSRFHEGLAALDIEPNGKAAAETRELFLWVCEKVITLPNTLGNELTKLSA